MYSRVFLYIALGVAGVFTLAAFVVFGIGGFMRSTADYRGGTAEKEKVVADPESRIANYEYFYETCNDIQAKNEQIKNTEDQLKFVDGEEQEKLQASKFALEQQKEELVGDYNAKASQTETRGQFRDASLPYHIDPDAKEVRCGS